MDYSFFALGLLGALVGYIVGDFQRQRRYRREARANLALANQRAIERAHQRAHRNRNTDATANSHSDNDGPTFALGSVRTGEARRRAVPRPYNRNRPGRYVAGGDTGSTDEKAMSTATMVGLL